MKKEEVIEIAHRSGIELARNQHGNLQFRCFETELERFANEVERRTLERAVAVCIGIANKPSNVVLGVAIECANEIRALNEEARLCGTVKGWTINSASLDALFRKARDNCLISDLRFHDARATALTILAKRVDVLVLSRISRHKNLKMLSEVYFRKTASEIAAGL